MILLKRFLLMIQFFTTVPIPVSLNVNEEDFGKGLALAPLAGLLIGGLVACGGYVLNMFFAPAITAVLVVILYILLTGGIHFDGLGDTVDGIFSNKPKEKMLEIMRDSRTGTYAVLVIVCVLGLNAVLMYSIISAHMYFTLVLMPVAGRIGSVTGAAVSRYARSGPGLGKSFIDYCGLKEMLSAAVISLIVFFVFKVFEGIFLCLFMFISATLLVKILGRKIGGATGDVLGAVCELNQTIFLLISYLLVFK
ncbi:adenosylcobinamide-GDP ribazoletransferase [Ruminiclostridium cellulolyticum]|uniref:Adenosylcobinamide-GDP ribazoletransferase n=1 Tax=Ruminiclostridium cellulolyticum (strain ATCC 35319 / DSM 5812 / JCM 6584 / H10) TaxID=394503 RepID=B8I7A2_RUMCH|nr:adenosylcobinamide-GDP ribazoletransferase [Ruminiclostridium cellulolyticum]ACL75026.1 cobalamin 5'-phosphate synthase [Ruminiclostridium cellulolyticum H10]